MSAQTGTGVGVGGQIAERSKPTAIIIKAAALRTLMAVPVLLPRHIQSGGGGGAHVRLQGVSAGINSREMNPLSLFLASDAGRGRRTFSRQKSHRSGDAFQPLTALGSTKEANRGIFGSHLSSFKG